MSQELPHVTFPYIQVQVGQDGIVIETFFAPTVFRKMRVRGAASQ